MHLPEHPPKWRMVNTTLNAAVPTHCPPTHRPPTRCPPTPDHVVRVLLHHAALPAAQHGARPAPTTGGLRHRPMRGGWEGVAGWARTLPTAGGAITKALPRRPSRVRGHFSFSTAPCQPVPGTGRVPNTRGPGAGRVLTPERASLPAALLMGTASPPLRAGARREGRRRFGLPGDAGDGWVTAVRYSRQYNRPVDRRAAALSGRARVGKAPPFCLPPRRPHQAAPPPGWPGTGCAK